MRVALLDAASKCSGVAASRIYLQGRKMDTWPLGQLPDNVQDLELETEPVSEKEGDYAFTIHVNHGVLGKKR